MRPDIPLGPSTRRALVVLGLLAVAKAAGLALMAQGIASGIAGLASGVRVEALVPATLMAAAGILLRAAAQWGTAAAGRWAAAGVKEELRAQLVEAGLAGPAAPVPGSGGQSVPADDGGTRVASSAAGTAVLAGRGLDELDALYTQYLPALVQTAAIPLLVGARILGADWVSALILVLTLPLVPVFMVLIGRHTVVAVSEAQQSLLRFGAHLVELAQGLPVLVGLGRAAEQRAALAELSRAYKGRTMATLRVAFLSALALELISTISVAVVAVFIGVRLVYGGMPLEAGLLALILAPECFQPLRDLGGAHHASEDGTVALRRARERIAAPRGTPLLPPTADGGGSGAVSAPTGACPAPELRVEGLAVQYDGTQHAAAGPVTFRVPAGTITLLAGPSGSGKTTVLAAIGGIVRDGAGAAVGGTVRGGDPARLAWVPQHPQFTQDIVADELELYAGGAWTPSLGESLLARLGLGGLGNADPSELSPGQQRRVAVARGLARVADGANLVLLDEPTAHLDEASAALVEGAIRSFAGRATVLLVSHEARTAALADRVVELAPSFSAPSERFGEAGEADPGAQAVRGRRHGGAPTCRGWLRMLAAIVRPDAATYVRAVLAGLGAAAAGIALSTLSGWLIVRASEQPPILYLLTAITGVRFFGVARAVLRYRERLVLHSAVLSTLTVLRDRLWGALSARGLAARRLLVPGAALESLVGDVEAVRDQLPRVLHPIATALLVGAGALVAVWIMLPAQVPALAAALVAALVIAPAVALTADQRAAQRLQTGRSAFLARIGQALAAAADLAGNARTATVLGRLRAADARLTLLERRGAGAEGLGQAMVLAATGMAAAVTLGTASASGAAATTAAAVLLLQLALAEPLTAASAAVQQLPALRSALARAATEESASAAAARPPAASREPVAPGVRLRGVAVGWPGGPDVVSGLDLEARPGDWVVLAGPSGSGKSTMLALLTGFLTPRRGSAAVGGRVAWCPQEAHLFDSTVRGNLAIARRRGNAASDDELEDALRRVGLLEHVRSLPGGLDARIGSRGSFLSGGQRQRLAVARTLLAGAEVVLLDEPTAHLDPESGLELVAALHRALADKAVIMVTHHASELMAGDALVELHGGGEPACVPQAAGSAGARHDGARLAQRIG